jgi:hypothetical protein
MTTFVPPPIAARPSVRRALAAPALVASPLFVLTAAALSTASADVLRTWGWTALDHHGVPWPSSLALVPGGWLQSAAFAVAGTSLVTLAAAQPRGVRGIALGVAGAGVALAAFPLDLPVGDPASMTSWITSWHAVVHTGGFAVAGLAGLVAVAASRRRGDVAWAALLATAAALGGTPGWYAYVAGFFGWATLLAVRVRREGQAWRWSTKS